MKVFSKIEKKVKIDFMKIKQADEIYLPEIEGNQIRLITTKTFNTVDFLDVILSKENHIDECIMTYSAISKKAIDKIEIFLSGGQIENLYFQCSITRAKDKPGLLKILQENKLIKGSLFSTHAKILLCKCGDNYYSIEGSGNISSNARIEQYIIENSKQTYDYHKKWIGESPLKLNPDEVIFLN